MIANYNCQQTNPLLYTSLNHVVEFTDIAISMVKFLREVKIELTKVTYPSRDEVIRLTGIVVIVSVAIGIYLGALDYAFTKFLEFAIN